jgi:transglutaminase-like putative cysteine protease
MKKIIPFLFVLTAACPRTGSQADAVTRSYWLGWYEKGHKVGYMQSIFQSHADRYRFERRGKLTTEMMGNIVTAAPVTVCNTDKTFALKDFDFIMETPGHRFHVSGAVRGAKIQMTVESGNQRQTSALDVEGPVYPLEALPNLLRSRTLTPNTKYELIVFDPMVQKTSNAEITLLGPDRLTLRDTVFEVNRFSALLFGVPHTVWVDSGARVLREDAPPSSVMLLEPGAEAMATMPEQAPPDLMSMFAVPSNIRLDNARRLKSVKMQIMGIEPRSFDLADETQKVLNTTPLQLLIAPPAVPAGPVPLPVTSDTAATRPTPAVQSDNALIIRKAREIAAGNTDAVQVARALSEWVFANVRQKGTPSMPSATDVLQTMEGDCNEHAVLYAALCRAIGIPCKIAVGLVYRDGYFWYHAWNKVFLGTWVPVDPTFGQFPIDATHLKLTEGEMDKQAQVLTVVGNLVINILEAK